MEKKKDPEAWDIVVQKVEKVLHSLVTHRLSPSIEKQLVFNSMITYQQ
jgi:hypothetical protein